MLKIEKFVRDPIYGFIGLTDSEIKLLSSPFLQRLRRIKQLGNTHLVYPSACHSRFEHSLGVLHVANRMVQKIELSKDQIRAIRYAAILHDIGHGPLSHDFEDVLKSKGETVSHEDITKKIISEDKVIGRILGRDKKKVLELFDEENETVSNEIISSNIDADKLDYLRRDSFHIGVAYGVFDFERILHTINMKSEDDRSYLTILWKGKDALENYRLARYLMHTQVYQHHVRAISDSMFRRAVKIAIREGTLDNELFNLEDEDFLKNYQSMDDIRFFDRILLNSSPESNDYKLINCLENRKLLKRGFEVNVNNKLDYSVKSKIIKMKPSAFSKIEEKLAGEAGCDKDFVIIYKQEIENALYKSSYAYLKENKTPIIIEDEHGELTPLEEESLIHSSSDPLMKFYIFCPEEAKETIRRIARDVLF